MRRLSLIGAAAVLAISAGITAAHAMPPAADTGLATAQNASGQDVPVGAGNFNTLRDAQNADPTQNPDATPPADTHGSAVSSAAQNPTPTDGSWANHGAYVSSVATGWGQQTAASHRPSPSDTPTDPPLQPGSSFNPQGLTH